MMGPPTLLVPALLALAQAASAAEATQTWCRPVEIAAGGGLRGPWQQNDSRYDYVDDATVAIDGHGAALVAWVDQRRKDVFFQAYDRDGRPRLREAANVSRTPHVFSWLPRIALSQQHAGDVYVLWQEIVFSGGSHGGDIFFARSRDGGATFAQPLNLSNSIAGDGKGRINRDIWHNGSLDIAVAPDGTIYAAWTEYEGPLWMSRSTDRGETFTKPMQIDRGRDPRPARAPALAVAPDGTVVIAWTVGDDDSADIRLSRSADGGRTFTAPHVVAKTPGYSDAPKLAFDMKGTLHLAYAESVAGPFDQYRVRYARSRDGGRTFERERNVSPTHPQSIASAAFPGLALDAGGGVYILWDTFANHRRPPSSQALTVSRDGGDTFGGLAIFVNERGNETFNGSLQGLLMRKLAVNAAGDIAVVNSTFREGVGSRVWLTRGFGGAARKCPP